MLDFFRQLMNGIVDAWKQLSLSARVNIGLAGAAVVILIFFVVYMNAKPQYVTLTTVEAGEATKYTEILSQSGISYRLEDNNQRIRVRVADLSNAQLALAEKEMPIGRNAAPGFTELYAENELMTNRALQDVKFMRAIQGELQSLLNAFDFVEYSLVLIREAKSELFVSEQQPSQADVTLKTTRPLTKKEVKAIVSIVSNAGGANLTARNITVTTTTGEVLHLPPQSEFASIANSKLELVTEWERQRETKIMAKLTELGVRGTVSVSAKMDFDELEETVEQVSEGTELSTYAVATTTTSKESLPEGTPGAFANVPEGTAAPGGMQTNEETNEEIINYEPSRTVRTRKTDPGNVMKYLVTLVVEGKYEDTTDADGNVTRTYVGLDDTLRQTYKDLAMATVGEGEAETVVTIHDHPFDIDQLAAAKASIEELEAAKRREWMLQLGWQIGQIVLIILGFFLVRIFLTRAIEKPAPVVEEEEEVIEIPEATREDMRREEVSREIRELAAQQPEVVAALLRTWMSEEED